MAGPHSIFIFFFIIKFHLNERHNIEEKICRYFCYIAENSLYVDFFFI